MEIRPTTRQKTIAGLIALVAWFALVLQFILILDPAVPTGIGLLMRIINFFSYFTILSNILVAICLTAVVTASSSAVGRFFSRVPVQSAIAVYIFIVGLVYNLVLRNIWAPTGWQLAADNLLHVAVPLLFLLYWFLFTPTRTLQWKQLFPWLIFPAIYLLYSLVRGAGTGWYPYPFLNAGELGYKKVAVNSLAVLIAFVVVGAGIIGISRFSNKKTG